jgi:hypothetical protein
MIKPDEERGEKIIFPRCPFFFLLPYITYDCAASTKRIKKVDKINYRQSMELTDENRQESRE